MKKSIFILVFAAFMIGSLGIGCKMNSEKEKEKEGEKVTEATHEAKQDAEIKMAEHQALVDEAEWNAFKKEIEAEMKADEMAISELKKEAKKPGKKHDAAYISSIDTMEKKHAELQKEIETYDKNQKTWDEFKAGFKKDMKSLEKEVKDAKEGKK